jgi:fatty acid desaturase
MESGSKRLHQKIAAMFTWFDLLILLAAGALGVFFLTTAQGDPNARYIIFWVLLACAAVLIGVKHGHQVVELCHRKHRPRQWPSRCIRLDLG